jgi:hypothetical protein
MKRNYSQNLSVSPGNVFNALELMVESHIDLTGLCSVAIFVDAVVKRPENHIYCPVVMEAYHAQEQDKVDT